MLPILHQKDEIHRVLASNVQVIIIKAPTGSGKSTILPVIFSEHLSLINKNNNNKKSDLVGCTQPRRIAALALRNRVSCPKNPAICWTRDHKEPLHKKTKIVFMTEGMAIAKMFSSSFSSSDTDGSVLAPEAVENNLDFCFLQDEKEELLNKTEKKEDEKDKEEKEEDQGEEEEEKEEKKEEVEKEKEEKGLLERFKIFIVDEAHERHTSTDMVLSLLGYHAQKTKDFKLVVCSATIDPQEFSDFFEQKMGLRCATIHVAASTYPVEIKRLLPLPPDHSSFYNNSSFHTKSTVKKETYEMQQKRLVPLLMDLRRDPLIKNVLIFLPGKQEVERAKADFVSFFSEDQQIDNNVISIALHGGMTVQDQERAISFTTQKKKFFFSTNIAESSLTIPGIDVVVDLGLEKRPEFDPELRIVSLLTRPCSQSSLSQRSGRAGREKPGICYRLFSEHDELSRKKDPQPEILGAPISSIVLAFGAMRIDFGSFLWMTPPPLELIAYETERLVSFGAFGAFGALQSLSSSNNKIQITPKGRAMAQFSLEPAMSSALYAVCTDLLHIYLSKTEGDEKKEKEGKEEKKKEEKKDGARQKLQLLVDLFVMLQLGDPFYTQNTPEKRQACMEKKRLYQNMAGYFYGEGAEKSDHCVLAATLFDFERYLAHSSEIKESDERAWCKSRGLVYSVLKEALYLKNLLLKRIYNVFFPKEHFSFAIFSSFSSSSFSSFPQTKGETKKNTIWKDVLKKYLLKNFSDCVAQKSVSTKRLFMQQHDQEKEKEKEKAVYKFGHKVGQIHPSSAFGFSLQSSFSSKKTENDSMILFSRAQMGGNPAYPTLYLHVVSPILF